MIFCISEAIEEESLGPCIECDAACSTERELSDEYLGTLFFFAFFEARLNDAGLLLEPEMLFCSTRLVAEGSWPRLVEFCKFVEIMVAA